MTWNASNITPSIENWSIRDKLAVVRGGTSGIGLAIARQLSELGARVVVTGTTVEKGKAVIEAFPQIAFEREMTFEEYRWYRATHKGIPSALWIAQVHWDIDIIVNCAGTILKNEADIYLPSQAGIDALSRADHKIEIALGSYDYFRELSTRTSQGVHSQLFQKCMVNISSSRAVFPLPGKEHYSSVNAFVAEMPFDPYYQLPWLAMSAVCPEKVDTAFLREKAFSDPALLQEYAPPESRCTPEDIADVVTALIRDRADKQVMLVGKWKIKDVTDFFRTKAFTFSR